MTAKYLTIKKLQAQNTDLLKALKEAFVFLDGIDFTDDPEWSDMVTQVEEAIAAAEGE